MPRLERAHDEKNSSLLPQKIPPLLYLIDQLLIFIRIIPSSLLFRSNTKRKYLPF